MADPTINESEPLLLPRGLILLAAVWLLTSWMLSLGVSIPVEPSSASFTPGIRMMLMCLTIGVMIGWPLLRLSESRMQFPMRQTILDMVVLGSLLQVVLWPLRLVTPWSPVRTAAIDMTILGWMVLVGALIASAAATAKTGVRNLAIVSCIALCLCGPVIAWGGTMIGGADSVVQRFGPLSAIYDLAHGGGAPTEEAHWQAVGLLTTAAVAAWIVVSVSTLSRHRRAMRDAE